MWKWPCNGVVTLRSNTASAKSETNKVIEWLCCSQRQRAGNLALYMSEKFTRRASGLERKAKVSHLREFEKNLKHLFKGGHQTKRWIRLARNSRTECERPLIVVHTAVRETSYRRNRRTAHRIIG